MLHLQKFKVRKGTGGATTLAQIKSQEQMIQGSISYMIKLIFMSWNISTLPSAHAFLSEFWATLMDFGAMAISNATHRSAFL